MDTVLGLSITSTTLGWALLDARDTAGAPLAGEELRVARRGGGDAGSIAAYASAIVARLHPVLTGTDLRIRGIGVAFGPDAVAAAALVLERLAAAGFADLTTVRPVQSGDAPLPARHAALAPLTSVLRTPPPPVDDPAGLDCDPVTPPRRLSYTGAAAMLAGGAITLVVSLSVVLSPHLGPAEPVASAPATSTAARAAGAVSAPRQPVHVQPEAPEAPVPMGALWERPPAGEVPVPPPVLVAPAPSGPRSLLDRMREHLPHLPGH